MPIQQIVENAGLEGAVMVTEGKEVVQGILGMMLLVRNLRIW